MRGLGLISVDHVVLPVLGAWRSERGVRVETTRSAAVALEDVRDLQTQRHAVLSAAGYDGVFEVVGKVWIDRIAYEDRSDAMADVLLAFVP